MTGSFTGSLGGSGSNGHPIPHSRATDREDYHREYDITARDEPHPLLRAADRAETGVEKLGRHSRKVADHATAMPGRISQAISHGLRWVGDANIIVKDAFRRKAHLDGTEPPKGFFKRAALAAHQLNIATGRRAELAGRELVRPQSLNDGSDTRPKSVKDNDRARLGRGIHTGATLIAGAGTAAAMIFSGSKTQQPSIAISAPTPVYANDKASLQSPEEAVRPLGVKFAPVREMVKPEKTIPLMDGPEASEKYTPGLKDGVYTLELPVGSIIKKIIAWNEKSLKWSLDNAVLNDLLAGVRAPKIRIKLKTDNDEPLLDEALKNYSFIVKSDNPNETILINENIHKLGTVLYKLTDELMPTFTPPSTDADSQTTQTPGRKNVEKIVYMSILKDVKSINGDLLEDFLSSHNSDEWVTAMRSGNFGVGGAYGDLESIFADVNRSPEITDWAQQLNNIRTNPNGSVVGRKAVKAVQIIVNEALGIDPQQPSNSR